MPIQPITVPLTGGRSVVLTLAASNDPSVPNVRVLDHLQKTVVNTLVDFTRQGSVDHYLRRGYANLQQPEIVQVVQAWESWKAAVEAEQQAAKNAEVHAAQRAADAERGLQVRRRRLHESDDRCLVQNLADPEQLCLVCRERNVPDDTLLIWAKDRLHQAAILDLDFHGERKAPLEDVESLMRCLSPAPRMWWLTQGGGAHALYLPMDLCDAYELAVGGCAQLSCDPTVVYYGGSLEIKAGTRHPAALQNGKRCGAVHDWTPTQSFQCLARLSESGVAEDELEEFLAEKGWKLGESLAHGHCPIDPQHVSNSAAPVFLGERGIYCHSCAGRLGSRTVPWVKVMAADGFIPEDDGRMRAIADAARHLTHFNHVDYLFDAFLPGIKVEFRRPLYRALLKLTLKSSEDARIARAFDDFGFVRGDGVWLHRDTLLLAKPLNKDDVSVLPSCVEWTVDDKGEPKLKPKETSLSIHVNTGNIPGWMPIAPHPFLPIYLHHNRPENSLRLVNCFPKRAADASVEYIPAEKRLPLAEAERRIEAYFPGISLLAMRALLVAIGCAEAGKGRVPVLWLTGDTGSAKTTHVDIIASMLGEDKIDIFALLEQKDRLNQVYGTSLERSRCIMFDDFAKDVDLYPFIQNFIIHLHSTHTYHGMYKGALTVPIRAPIILTDRNTPGYFLRDLQFGRRVHILPLPGRIAVGWDTIGHYAKDWWKSSPELRAAACAFFSDVVDEFFHEGAAASVDAAMAKLGVSRVVEYNNDMSEADTVRDLTFAFAYELCRTYASQKVFDYRAERFIFRGALVVDPNGSSTLSCLAMHLFNSRNIRRHDWTALDRILADHAGMLQESLGLSVPAYFHGRQVGNRIYVALHPQMVQGHRSRSKLINHELWNVWPPPPDAPYIKTAQEAGPPGVTNMPMPTVLPRAAAAP